MKKPRVNVVYDPRANIWLNKNLDDDWPLIENFLSQTMEVCSSCEEWDELPDYLEDEKYKPLIIMTQDQRDLAHINYLAGEFNQNTDTVILWVSQRQKPHSTCLPIVSWQQLQNCKDMLKWETLYKLAQTPQQPA